MAFGKRHRIPRRKSERSFTHSAKRVHTKNLLGAPMRGGIRL